MGFAANKMQSLDSQASKARRNVLNQDPSQKSGSLRNITQPAASAIATVGGTVSNVGHVVGKVAGVLGATGLQNALEGSSETDWHNTYSKKDTYVPGDPGYEPGSPNRNLKKKDRTERSGRRLKDFFTQMQQAGGARVDTLNTFEMTIDFEPSPGSFVSVKSLGPNPERSVVGSIFLQYSSEKKDSKLIGDLVFDLGLLVQKMTLPNITLAGGQTVKTLLGEFPVNGLHLQPDQHTFTLDVLNLTRSIHEDIFYKWMREVAAPFWIYPTQPYTTANVTIDFTEHTNLKYVFLNCRPSNIMTLQPSQEPNTSFSRQIQFTFDWMYVQSASSQKRGPYKSKAKSLHTEAKESTLDKIAKVGNAANFSASNILKI